MRVRPLGPGAVLALLGALALSTPFPAAPADTPWYQVEIVVFAQGGEAAWHRDNWREEGPPPLAENTVELLVGSNPGAGAGGSARRHAFRTLPASGLDLGGAMRRLERSDEYRVLLHVGWLQPGFSEQDAPAVHLSAPRGFAPEARFDAADDQGIDGTVRLWRRRFLHMTVDLAFGDIEGWRQRVAGEGGHANRRPNERTGAPQEPRAGRGPGMTPPASGSDPRSTRNVSVAGPVVAGIKIETEAETESNSDAGERLRVVRLVRDLRLKTGGLHYVDHPLLGVLVLAKPLG